MPPRNSYNNNNTSIPSPTPTTLPTQIQMPTSMDAAVLEEMIAQRVATVVENLISKGMKD